MEEVWKPVVGYEGLYEVSNLGRVRSLDRYVTYSNGNVIFTKGRILSTPIKDYCHVCLCDKNNNHKTLLVHRLVAQAFIPNPKNYPVVNHKDCNPSNNHVDNLEWCTQQYNTTYAGAPRKRGDKKSKPVNMLSVEGVFIKTFKSATEAGLYFNKRRGGSNISAVANFIKGKYTAYGYRWEWA